MKQNRISKIFFALGMLLLCNPSLAQSQSGDSIGTDSLSLMIHENSGKVQELTQITSSQGTIIMILTAVLAVSVFILILLVISKLRKHKHHNYKGISPFYEELHPISERVGNLEIQKSKIEEDIKNIKDSLDVLNKQMAQLQPKKEEENKKVNTQGQSVQKKISPTVQYLKAGNDENFFYEGESSNSEGCQFKVKFHNKSNGSKAELTIITDIENLKTIPAPFLKKVIHTKNNVTMKDATSFSVTQSGTCEFKQDGDVGIWMIKRPIEVKLNK